MLELYQARLAHIDALYETSLFSEMESSILNKTASSLRKILNIQDSDITEDDFVKRIIQSSRMLHIGNSKNPISNEDRSNLARFLSHFMRDNLEVFKVTETNSKYSSVAIKLGDIEYCFMFSPPREPKPFRDLENYVLYISEIEEESLGGGWVSKNRKPMVECKVGHYWNAGETIAYLNCINQQGLKLDSEIWMGHIFEENESHRIIYDFVLSEDTGMEESDLRDLRMYTSEYMYVTCFTDFDPSFDLANYCLQKMTNFLTSTYQYNKYGYDYGEIIGKAFLVTCLVISENDEHIEKIARTLVEGLSYNIEMDEIKDKVNEHINQLNKDSDAFEMYDKLEQNSIKLYKCIDEIVKDYFEE
jgi:hypothetical protein